MSLIRSLFDYCFIILQSGTKNIRAEMQKMQNRVLRIIKYFPLKKIVDYLFVFCTELKLLQNKLKNKKKNQNKLKRHKLEKTVTCGTCLNSSSFREKKRNSKVAITQWSWVFNIS
ncbi:hypothetical protein BpHYR1_000057 [Brachionus plicatilis]|uniref:Uncharacterized protein n=1 Tax=Brachionus plicatilis TaxID=10195 RepID=A0A3M7PUN8_BRAPC|nr:hypothetical protein BpHYR1_000057 [Brachionus plicatilis]